MVESLPGRVVILLHGVDDALAGGEIDRAPAGDRERRGAALRGVLALGLDGDLLLAPDVQFALGVGLLVNLAALGRGRDRVKDAALGDARLDILRHQLVAVAGHADAGVFRPIARPGASSGNRRGRRLRGIGGPHKLEHLPGANSSGTELPAGGQ